MNDCVLFKGKKDRIIIHLNTGADFATIKDSFSEKIRQIESFINNSKVAIEFTGRNLSETEENILLNVIAQETKIRISFVFSENSIFSGQPKSLFKDIKNISDEGITKFHKGTLRSGHSINYDGNVIILGDVNPGAVVKAGGNVIVLGYLNGTVHAGINNEEEAFIASISLNPIQIRIGQCITKNPDEDILEANKVKKTFDFEIAYLKDGQIIIERLNKTTLEHMMKI